MIVIEKFHPNNGYGEDPLLHLNLKRFEDSTKDCYLFLGDAYEEVKKYEYLDKKRIFLSLEEPNFCTPGHHVDTFNKYVDEVLTICPYTAKSAPKRTFTFFPFNEEFISADFNKQYDVIYSGTVHSSVINNFIEIIKNFNYRFISYGGNSLITNPNASYEEKIDLYSKSKVSIIHNLVFPHNENVPRYRAFPNALQNEAFKCLDIGLMPQIKSRVFEAAFSKSLILCYHDNWNVIEYFFDKDKEFVYFYDAEDLRNKLIEILNNYEKYEKIAENAFEKAINNYSTKHFTEKFIGGI